LKVGKAILATLLAGLISILIAIFGQPWLGDTKAPSLRLPDFKPAPTDRLQQLPGFSLPNPEGVEVASSDWLGKVVVLHFWASWCQPCQRDTLLLDAYQGASEELKVVGIAIDTPRAVTDYLAQSPVSYEVLIGGGDAVEMSRRLGNRLQGLPFTVVFDHAGRRVHAHFGEIAKADMDEWLPPLLAKAALAKAKTP
jgi:thiol-disulfide isomerase/thioredoxin